MNNWVHFLISVYLLKLPIKAVYQKYEEKKNLVPLQQRKRYLKYWVEGIKHIQKLVVNYKFAFTSYQLVVILHRFRYIRFFLYITNGFSYV